MTTEKGQAKRTRRRRVPQVFIEPTPIAQVPRVEQGRELINPKYKTERFNRLLHYLATERRIILYDPVEPRNALDDEIFPVLPVLFKDRWRSQWPDASLRVELLQLQARNANARFADLLTKEERNIVCEVVRDEMSRRGVTPETLYHESGVPTPCHEFPLDLFARRGFPTNELWEPKHTLEDIRLKPRPRRKKAPERIVVVRAWEPFDLAPREILRGSNGTPVTLKGYAFCQFIRSILHAPVKAGSLILGKVDDPAYLPRQIDWFGNPVQKYFHTPTDGTLRWYSWIAQPLFYLLQAGDDWAWTRFSTLVRFLGWRREQADLFRSWVTPPSANKKYQSVKRGILADVGRARRKRLLDWFRRLEEQFIAGIMAFGKQALRVHWLMKDSQFVIPYLLLYIYSKPNLKRYQNHVQTYLRNLKPLLQETPPPKPERFAYPVWEFETVCRHDSWYSVCLNWEIWVGSEDMLRAVFAPVRHKGAPPKFEVKRVISGCLPLFGELSGLRIRSRIRRGMEICNALCGEDIYPSGSENVFDRDMRRVSRRHEK